MPQVIENCPQSCGLCCEDDDDFKWKNDNKSDILPVYFTEPSPASSDVRLIVGIKGSGGASFGLTKGTKDNNGFYCKTVDGRDRDGQFIEQVQFKFRDIANNIIPDIYFYI